MQANKLLGAFRRFTQPGDGQGRGVARKNAIFWNNSLGPGSDVGLQGLVLKNRFDNQIATRQIVIGSGWLDQAEQGVVLRFGKY